MTPTLFALTFASAIGAGLVAGVFLAFSVFIMRALAGIPEAHGIGAMQAINVTVITPLFLGPFLGTGAACLLVVIAAVRDLSAPAAPNLLAGGVLYLGATLAVTLLRNVPLNDTLARVRAGEPEGAATWRHYVARWTFWNHVRTIGAVGAAILLTLALHAG